MLAPELVTYNCAGPNTNKLGCCFNVSGGNTGLELLLGDLQWGATVGRLFSYLLWPTQEGDRHRPEYVPGQQWTTAGEMLSDPLACSVSISQL